MWYKYYSWEENPFSIKPSTLMVGMDDEMRDLQEHLVGGNACLLTGSLGSGKTSLLKATKKLLSPRHRVVYLNAEKLPENFEIQPFLMKQRNLLERLFRRQPRSLIFMLDEGHMTSHEFKDELKVLFDEGVILGLVVAQVKPPYTFSDSLKHRVGSRVITLPPLADEHVVELVNVRTGGEHPFHAEALKVISKHASYNPRRILEFCEAVAKHGAHQKLEEIPVVVADEALARLTTLSEALPQLPVLPAQRASSLEQVDAIDFTAMEKRIVKVLLEASRKPEELAEILSSTKSGINAHITGLVERGVVSLVSRSPKVYALTDEFLSDLIETE